MLKNKLKHINLFEYYVSTKPIKKVLSKSKLKHSKRVANNTTKMVHSEDVYNAGLYHDFLEKGGDVIVLKNIVNEYTYDLIIALSHDEDGSVLKTIKKNLLGKDIQFINDIVVIKLCDRADNLKRRLKENNLSKDYVKKSVKLIQHLYDIYQGDKTTITKFINKKILPLHKKFQKKLILT